MHSKAPKRRPELDAGGRQRLALAVVSSLLIGLPFLVVDVPPITDAAQQMAQIPLLLETLAGDAPEYRIHWWAPNRVCYAVLGAAWAVAGPYSSVKLATYATAVVWVLALHWLCAGLGRPAGNAVVASALVFNASFYMGFLNFSLGLLAFAYWHLKVARPTAESTSGRRIFLRALFGSLLLYFCHALWFQFSLLWFLFQRLRSPESRRVVVLKLLGAAPAGLLAVAFFFELNELGWSSPNLYGPAPWTRLMPTALVDGFLGGLTGWLEPLAIVFLAVWMLMALLGNRSHPRAGTDRFLLATAAFFFALGLILPISQDRTILFAPRWLPIALALCLIALPDVGLRYRRQLAVLFLAVFSIVTARQWAGFEKHELSGLRPALASLPTGSRVLGLDFYRTSERFKYPPYFQMHAYAQLVRGSRLGFSFVSHPTSLVIRKEAEPEPPTMAMLVWRPHQLRRRDVEPFDYLLVHAPPETTAHLLDRDRRLERAGPPGRWQLLRVRAEGGGSEFNLPEPDASSLSSSVWWTHI